MDDVIKMAAEWCAVEETAYLALGFGAVFQKIWNQMDDAAWDAISEEWNKSLNEKLPGPAKEGDEKSVKLSRSIY